MRRLKQYTIGGCLVLALLLVSITTINRFPELVGSIADGILADAKIPSGSEPPMTAHAVRNSGQDVQVIGGLGLPLRCSLDRAIEWAIFRDEVQPIGLQMRQACITHDYCYRHGNATYGYSQEDCDFRLLRDAMRLCLFIARSAENEQNKCRRMAKKVVLGVRVGGSKSFLRRDTRPDDHRSRTKGGDDGYSTYFEYEAFSINSDRHVSSRIADAPIGGGKAHYRFRVKPAGLRLEIRPLRTHVQASQGPCRSYLLPTTASWLTNAPMVVKRRFATGGEEDWLVWFQRQSLATSGSRFLIIAPGRASFHDWQRIFPGMRSDCADLRGLMEGEHLLARTPFGPVEADRGPASAFVWTGGKPNYRLKNATSEFHPVPGLERADGSIALMSLRTNACGSRALCYSRYDLQPKRQAVLDKRLKEYVDKLGLYVLGQEPLTVRDRINFFGDGAEYKRYRNFAAPPMVFEGDPVGSDEVRSRVFSWLRRGTGIEGKDYRTRAELRRGVFLPARVRSRSAGIVRLEELGEGHEPLIVMDRASRDPALVSIHAPNGEIPDDDRGTSLAIDLWRLPRPWPATAHSSRHLAWNARARSVRSRSDCAAARLDPSWLLRSASALPATYGKRSGLEIVFSRLLARENAGERPRLEIARLFIGGDGTCRRLGLQTLEPPHPRMAYGPLTGQISDRDGSRSYLEMALRSTPLLVWRATDGAVRTLLPLPFGDIVTDLDRIR